jgi:hypothetical protein
MNRLDAIVQLFLEGFQKGEVVGRNIPFISNEIVYLSGQGKQSLGSIVMEFPGDTLSLFFLGAGYLLEVIAEAFINLFFPGNIPGGILKRL